MRTLKEISIDLERRVKTGKDFILKPFFKVLTFVRITPLFISIIALILGIAAAFYLSISRQIFLILIALSVFFDMVDGGLARYQKKASEKDFWLDYICDRIVVFSVMIGVVFSTDIGILYLLVPLAYLLVHLIYAWNRKNLIVIYGHPVYYLILFFDYFPAAIFSLAVDALNLIIFSIYFIFYSRKLP